MKKARAEKRNYFLFTHRVAGRELRDVEVYSGPVTLKGRKLLYSIIHDITDRKRAEESLRNSEKRYRLLVDNVEIAVVITSMTTGQVLFVNQQASVLFDVPLDEAIGRHARQHWAHPEDRDRFVAELTGAGRVTDYECALKTVKGAMRWVLVSANIIEYAGEQAAFIVYNDITERKRAEEALARQPRDGKRHAQRRNGILRAHRFGGAGAGSQRNLRAAPRQAA